jgi:DNA polymerase-3 subunit alpha
LGSAPVHEIVRERTENEPFKTIFDFAKRLNLRICNKKAFESLAYAGGFDSFEGIHRAQYFKEDNGRTFLENVVKFGAGFQDSENSAQASLFGEGTGAKMPEPSVPEAEKWGNVYALNREKEVIGIFISGHPLDDFKLELNSFCNGSVSMLNDMENNKNKDLLIGAVISDAEHRFTRKGDPFGTLTIEDYNDSYKIFLWRENYLKYKHFVNPGTFVAIKGRIEIPQRRKELEFTVTGIEMLQSLREKKASRLDIKVSTKSLDQRMVNDLSKVFEANVGNCPVQFMVYDPLDRIEVNMPSKTVKVDLTNELIKELDKFDLNYRIK